MRPIALAKDAGPAHSPRWRNSQAAASPTNALTTHAPIMIEALHAQAAQDADHLAERLPNALGTAWPQARLMQAGAA